MAYDRIMTPGSWSRQVVRTRQPDNHVENMSVEIGPPAQIPAGDRYAGQWYAPVRFNGINLSAITDVAASDGSFSEPQYDPQMALTYALAFAGTILATLPYKNELDISQLPNSGYPYWPTNVPIRVSSGTILPSPPREGPR